MPRVSAPAVLAVGVLLAAATAAEPRLPDALRAVYDESPIGNPLTAENLLRDTIDPHAQRAILKLSRDGDNQDRAFAMMIGRAAVRGALAGIYLENTRVPILRAKAAGLPWWEILPKDEHAICWAEPVGEPAVIVLDEAIRSDADAVSLALREAFLDCGLGFLVVDAVGAQGDIRQGCGTGIAASEALGFQGTSSDDRSTIEPLRPATYDVSAACEGNTRSVQSVVRPGEVTIEQIDPESGGADPAAAVKTPLKIRPAVAKKAVGRTPLLERSVEEDAGEGDAAEPSGTARRDSSEL